MFADSAFFDDPEQTYPTIEEQIDLARKVANVLTAEGAQRNSKGAKMFAKRQERSEKWTLESVGKGADSHTSEDSNLAPPIYNPLMANKPKPFSLSKFMQQNLAPDAEEAPIEHIPPNKMKINPLELENMRLKSTKSKPNIGDPNQCFSLAAALHSAKGKGGQIFAKRRAKSEKWVIDESNVKKSPHPPPQPRSGPTIYSKRGSETIAMKKSSPWEAAETGDMERAFKPVPSKRHTIIGGTVKPQPPGEENIPPVPQTNFKAEHKAGPAFRDFNYRARGWGGSKVVNKNQPVYTGPSKDFNTQPQPFTPPEGISQPEPHEPVDFNVHPTPFGQDRSSRMSGGVYDYEEIGSDL